MKKKYIICIVVIAVISISIGLFTELNKVSTSKKSDKLKENEVFNDTISGKHCIKKLCIESVNIEYSNKESLGNLGFMLVNTDKNNKQASGTFSFIPNSSTELIAYFDEIPAGEMIYVKIDFTNKEVINMTDYKLKDLQTNTYEKI